MNVPAMPILCRSNDHPYKSLSLQFYEAQTSVGAFFPLIDEFQFGLKKQESLIYLTVSYDFVRIIRGPHALDL
jgi:hypothetical protein